MSLFFILAGFENIAAHLKDLQREIAAVACQYFQFAPGEIFDVFRFLFQKVYG